VDYFRKFSGGFDSGSGLEIIGSGGFLEECGLYSRIGGCNRDR